LKYRRFAAAAFALTLSACASGPQMAPITTADYVDIPRFMGDWYVIANIPTAIEKQAYNALEQYELIDEKTVATTFSFNKGGFKGKRKTYRPTGFIYDDPSNAFWGMRFIWPIKADYRVVYIDPDYQHTIIGRNKRDYVWIMSRSSDITDQTYQMLVQKVAAEGYDVEKIRRVPHKYE